MIQRRCLLFHVVEDVSGDIRFVLGGIEAAVGLPKMLAMVSIMLGQSIAAGCYWFEIKMIKNGKYRLVFLLFFTKKKINKMTIFIQLLLERAMGI